MFSSLPETMRKESKHSHPHWTHPQQSPLPLQLSPRISGVGHALHAYTYLQRFICVPTYHILVIGTVPTNNVLIVGTCTDEWSFRYFNTLHVVYQVEKNRFYFPLQILNHVTPIHTDRPFSSTITHKCRNIHDSEWNMRNKAFLGIYNSFNIFLRIKNPLNYFYTTNISNVHF